MNRINLFASFGLVVGMAAVMSAQVPPSNGKVEVDPKIIHSIRVKVIGCVARGTEAGLYLLTHAVLSGDDTPSTAETAGKAGSGKDVSFENSASYDLIGGHLKIHVGHEVEVIGITSDAKLNRSDASRSANSAPKHEQATLTVSSVKMVAATCP